MRSARRFRPTFRRLTTADDANGALRFWLVSWNEEVVAITNELLGSRYDIDQFSASIVPLTAPQVEARDRLLSAIDTKALGFESVSCPVCGGSAMRPLANRDRYGAPYSFGVCERCGLAQANPYLDAASTDWFYENIFAMLHRGSTAPTNAKFQSRVAYARSIVRWLGKHGVEPHGTLIDVGCSSGGIVAGLQQAGFDAIGIDIDLDYIEDGRKRGLDLRQGRLTEVDIPTEPRVITYVQVLEHIVDIHAELSRLASVVGPESLIYVELPGPTSVPREYGFDTLKMLQLAHVWHFSATTLRAVFAAHGFTCVASDETVRALFRHDPAAAAADLSVFDDADLVEGKLRRYERLRPVMRPVSFGRWFVAGVRRRVQRVLAKH